MEKRFVTPLDYYPVLTEQIYMYPPMYDTYQNSPIRKYITFSDIIPESNKSAAINNANLFWNQQQVDFRKSIMEITDNTFKYRSRNNCGDNFSPYKSF